MKKFIIFLTIAAFTSALSAQVVRPTLPVEVKSGTVTVTGTIGVSSIAAGTVSATVTNFPAVQVVSGTVTVDGLTGGTLTVTSSKLDSLVTLAKTGQMLWGEVYASPQDFTASYTSTNTVTLTGAPFTVDDANCFVAKITYKSGGTTWKTLINAFNGVNITALSNVITVSGMSGTFTSTDVYRVVVLGQKKSYDATNDVTKVSEASPLWSRYAGPETILSASQAFTASWVDLESGYEIDCRGYNRLILYAVVDHTDGANYRFRALGKHTSAGSEEFLLPIKNVGTTDVAVNAHYYELDTDADQSIILDWDVTGIPYVQIQIQVGTIGAGTAAVTAAYATKAY